MVAGFAGVTVRDAEQDAVEASTVDAAYLAASEAMDVDLEDAGVF